MGNSDNRDELSRLDTVFDLVDFNKMGRISFDEMVGFLLSIFMIFILMIFFVYYLFSPSIWTVDYIAPVCGIGAFVHPRGQSLRRNTTHLRTSHHELRQTNFRSMQQSADECPNNKGGVCAVCQRKSVQSGCGVY